MLTAVIVASTMAARIAFGASFPKAEVDPLNFLPRVTLPVLTLNGRYDYYFPFETSQKPFFEYLGTRPEHKKWVVYPEAHTVPRTQYMRETLAWLDRYLGQVK